MVGIRYVVALVHSHAAGDHERFVSTVRQIAADASGKKQFGIARDLERLAERLGSRPIEKAVVLGSAGDAGCLTQIRVSTKLSDLVVDAPLRRYLDRVVAEQQGRDRLAEHGLQPMRRLLCLGPPGTGKTMTAAALAGELNLPLLRLELHAVIGSHLGETANRLAEVFRTLGRQRAVFLFDEFDSLAAERSIKNDVGEMRRALNSLLIMLDDDRSDSLVVATSNHEELLDSAIYRRFDQVLRYGLPDQDARIELARRTVGDLGSAGLDWTSVGTLLSGLAHGPLVNAVRSAAKRVVLDDRLEMTADDLRAGVGEVCGGFSTGEPDGVRLGAHTSANGRWWHPGDPV